MPLRSDIVGGPAFEDTVTVTARMALAYAAGIDEANTVTSDDLAPGFMAPPYFCVTLEWRLALLSRQRDMGLTPAEQARAVHAGQSTRFLAPLRPGLTARIQNQVIEARQTRAGALVRSHYTIENAQTGERLVSSIASSIFRGVAVEGENRVLPEHAEPQPEWQPPATWTRKSLHLDRWFAHRYTECAAIWNPIHSERRAAQAAGLGEPIVHGTALWALAGRELVAHYAPQEPGRLTALSGRFAAMVLPDTHITVEHGQTKNGAIAFIVKNDSGNSAIAEGLASFA